MAGPRLNRAHTYPVLTSCVNPVKAFEQRKPVAAKQASYINNIANSSELDREDFIIATVRPLVLYGATLSMIEEHLLDMSRHFHVKVTVARRPGIFVCVFGDYGNERRKVKITDDCRRAPNVLGLLHVDHTVTAVTENQMKILEGVGELNAMPAENRPVARPVMHLMLAVALSAGVRLTFGGSRDEVLCAFNATLVLCILQLLLRRISYFTGRYLEVILTIFVSLVSREPLFRSSIDLTLATFAGYFYMCRMLRNTESDGSVTNEGYLQSGLGLIYTCCSSSASPSSLTFT